MNSKYKSSISGENLVSKLRYAVKCKNTQNVEDLVWKKKKKNVKDVNNFYIDSMLKR